MINALSLHFVLNILAPIQILSFASSPALYLLLYWFLWFIIRSGRVINWTVFAEQWTLLFDLMLQVTTPLLKFMAEFVLNKAQRLTFDSSSPNGILLFREVSKLIVAYGSRVLSLPNAADIYAYKYKGMWICFTILARGDMNYFYFLLSFNNVVASILLPFLCYMIL